MWVTIPGMGRGKEVIKKGYVVKWILMMRTARIVPRPDAQETGWDAPRWQPSGGDRKL